MRRVFSFLPCVIAAVAMLLRAVVQVHPIRSTLVLAYRYNGGLISLQRRTLTLRSRAWAGDAVLDGDYDDGEMKTNKRVKRKKPKRKSVREGTTRELRLERLLANRGVGTRNEVARLVKQGRVTVNGEVCRSPSTKFQSSSVVRVDGTTVESTPLLMGYYKPVGVLTTLKDDWGRPDLSTSLPETLLKRVKPVGRLDADSSGLLLLSSNGTLTHKLLMPRFGVEREYVAKVIPKEGFPPPGESNLAERLREGVETADGTYPAEVLRIVDDKITLKVTEGKYRMVRRILANAGYPVLELHRTRYGAITMPSDAVPGETWTVTGEELKWAKWLVKTPEKSLVQPHVQRMQDLEQVAETKRKQRRKAGKYDLPQKPNL